MSISNSDIQKALKIGRAVKEFFETTTQKDVQAKELMGLFLEKKIFNTNHQDGLPVRDFLRHLEKNGHLHLIPQAHYEQRAVNKAWYFIRKG